MITAPEIRRHWRDQSAACNQIRAYRDDVWRFYDLHRYAPDHGRRWRGRQLDRANHDLCWVRRRCSVCSQGIDWRTWSWDDQTVDASLVLALLCLLALEVDG